MSSFDSLFTISLDEAALLDMAAQDVIGISRAKSPQECLAAEDAVLWAAESTQPFPEGIPTVRAIADIALERLDRIAPEQHDASDEFGAHVMRCGK